MSEQLTYSEEIQRIVEGILPLDALEAGDCQSVLDWIRSGEPLCRIEKPAIPPQHLVSYMVVVDPGANKLLLTDHKKSGLWLPCGGHVEPGEHPRDAALRELREELFTELPFILLHPLFLTVTDTTGRLTRHTDVSLWYVFEGDSSTKYSFDPAEFYGIQWFPMDELPLDRADPQLGRFAKKLALHMAAASRPVAHANVRIPPCFYPNKDI